MAEKNYGPSDLRRPERLITTHDSSGKAIFSDAFSSKAPFRDVAGGQMEFSLMYTTDGMPVSMSDDRDCKSYDNHLNKIPHLSIDNGTVVRTVDFGPGYTSAMHRTISIDFGVVIEGELELILDSGETRVMKRGDVAVQRGTNHAWRNMSKDKWARMLFVLQASQPLKIGEKELALDEAGID